MDIIKSISFSQVEKFCQCGCGKLIISPDKQGRERRFVRGHQPKNSPKGSDSPYWKGGRQMSHGYVMLYSPDHPRANPKGYVAEHVLVLERALGRFISPPETPHHIDGNRANNYIGNLMLFATHGMHLSYHHRLKAFEICGHYEWRQCYICHKYDALDKLSIINGGGAYHKQCARDKTSERRNKTKANSDY